MHACSHQARGGKIVKNPLDSLTGTVVAGLVITLVLYIIVKATETVGS
jgi:hypothetical protein